MNAETKFVQTYLSDIGILLNKYRRVMDSIHRGGNIFNNDVFPNAKIEMVSGQRSRLDAYNMVARLASDLRRDEKQKYA